MDWSLAAFKQWYPRRHQQPHFAKTMAAAQQSESRALPQLVKLINDDSLAAIVRASAVQQLRNFPNQYSLNNALVQLKADDALVRYAAVQAFEILPLAQRQQHLWPVLDDPVAMVRFEAIRLLAGLASNTATSLTAAQMAQLKQALADYMAALQINADSPSGQMQLGVLHQAQNQLTKAEQAYQNALLLEPNFIPAMLNMADIYRAQQANDKALPLIARALQIDADNLASNYSMGLLLVRLQQLDKALSHLQKAAALAPQISHYSYVYAVALFESGQRELSIEVLKEALQNHQGNRDILSALVSYLRATGKNREAQQYASQLPRREGGP